MIKSLVISLGKRYAVATVQEAIEAKGEAVEKWAKKIGVWLAKLRVATAFLERLAVRLADGKLEDEEAAATTAELGILATQITAKTEE